MKISDFDYCLPPSLIADKPKEKRDESNLLVLRRESESLDFCKFKNIENYINPGDLIILNDTKVIPARLIGRKPTGGKVEIFLLNKAGKKEWEALVKPGKRFKEGVKVYFDSGFSGIVEKVLDDGRRVIKFNYKGNFYEAVSKHGLMPLPPYIKNTPLLEKEIRRKYQTIFAKKKGAAAAPTAGLHFTKSLINKLKKKGIKFGFLTLHVGAGTFLPVNAENIEDHKMYLEYYKVSEKLISLIKETKKNGKRIIACGTTTLRTLETVFRNEKKNPRPSYLEGWTDIFIYPGFKFKVVDGLITNFHLPKSTLLLLVCAFASKEMIFKAYERAISKRFRFYSFGDAMLIIR